LISGTHSQAFSKIISMNSGTLHNNGISRKQKILFSEFNNGRFFLIAAGLVTRIWKYRPLGHSCEEITITHVHTGAVV
jgi:hypothetical protein